MVVAKWAKAVVAGLMCCGLALGQQYPPNQAVTTGNGKQIMDVPELGAGRKGEVIRSWREPDGKIAYLLRDISTGELVKVIDQDHGVIQAGATTTSKRRVFSWSRSTQDNAAASPMPANGTVVPGSERVISSRVISETVTPLTPAASGEKITPMPSTGVLPQGQVISEAPQRKGLFSRKQSTSPYAPAPLPMTTYPSATTDQGKVISSTVINEQPVPTEKKKWFGRDRTAATPTYTPMPASAAPAATADQGKVISSTVINEQPMPTEKRRWFGKDKPETTSAYTPMPASNYPAATVNQGKVISSTVISEQPMPTEKKKWFGRDKTTAYTPMPASTYSTTIPDQGKVISSPALPGQTMPAQNRGPLGKDKGVPQSAAPAPVSMEDKLISRTVLSETVVPVPGQSPVVVTTPAPMGTAAAPMQAAPATTDLRPVAAQAVVPQPMIISEEPQVERKGLFGRKEQPVCPTCCTPSCACTQVSPMPPSAYTQVGTMPPCACAQMSNNPSCACAQTSSMPSCGCTIATSTPSCGCTEAGTVMPAPVMVMEEEKSRHGLFSRHKDKEPYTVLPPPGTMATTQTTATKLEPMPIATGQTQCAPVRHSIFPLHHDKAAATIAQSPAAATVTPQANAAVPVRAAEIKRPTPNPMEQRPVPSTPPVPAAQASVPNPAVATDSSATKKAALFSWNRDQSAKPAAQATVPAATVTPTAAPKTDASKASAEVAQAKGTLPGDSKPAAGMLPAKVDSAWDYARKTNDGQIKVEKTSMPAAGDSMPTRQEMRSASPVYSGKVEKLPLGSGSVMAASGGKPGAVVYVPVPMMTMPQVTRQPVPPMPPQPQIPQPPKTPILPGSADEANAFMPKPPPYQVGPDAGITGAGNAFTVVQGPNPEGQGAFMNRGTGYPGMPPRQPIGYPVAPYGMMPPYGPMPQAVPQTVYVPMAQPGYPAPYGSIPQMQYPQAYVARPQAASPMAQAAKPQAAAEVVPAGYAAKEPTDEIARQLIRVLHDSMYPSERERAVDNLATRDWHSNPAVVDALVKCAQEDPAATVRAACVRGLAKMGANTVPVASALQSLKADSDPRVRHEVEQAAPALGLR